MAGMLRVRRSRGALSGFLLLLLGIWGALVPFAGPYFHFAYTPDHAWSLTSGRLWLEVLPGACAAAGGLIVLASRLRPVAVFGAWLAALSGAWFAVGGVLIALWSHGVSAGSPVGGKVVSAVEQVSFFTGLGVVIVFVAALALGRFTVVAARDVALAEQAARDAADSRSATASPDATPAVAGTTAAGPTAAGPTAAGTVPPARTVPQSRTVPEAGTVPASSPERASDTAGSGRIRTPVRARLTKVVPGKAAAASRQAAADQAAADQSAADEAAADQAAADQAAADKVSAT